MTKFLLPYGDHQISANIPSDIPVDTYLPFDCESLTDPGTAIVDGLNQPIQFDLLGFIKTFKHPITTAIAVNDKTRPVPHHILLPPLLHWLEQAGIEQDHISIIIASGTHTPMRPEEYSLILPREIIEHYKIIVHDCDDASSLQSLGATSAGTSIDINRFFLEADLRIVVGDIEPHHFMGYSGGVKTAAIGLAGRNTIRQNHSFITHPNARTGCFSDNPMRQDVEEIGKRIQIHLAVNAILNEHKEIVQVLVGNPYEVILKGIPLVRKMSQVPVSGLYDFVIASAGGHPKDINFYQAQKGLTHAAMLTRTGGVIILAAACPEGAGNRRYEEWMDGKIRHEQVLTEFASIPFEIGVHKAYLVSRIMAAKRVLIYSNLPPITSSRLLLEPIVSLQQTINELLEELPPGSRIAYMPQAVLTVPDFGE